MFDKAFKRVNTFIDYKTELVEGSEKRAKDSTNRACTKLEQEVAKKQKIDDAKVDDDQEEARMKELINIIPDEEEVAIDAILLATKPPCIVDWKIIKEGKISQFQIIRVYESSKREKDQTIYEEMDDSLERAATTATSLDAEQDRSSGPRRQETMGDTIAQIGFENVSKTSNDSLLAGVNTPQSDEDSMKLKELMEFCTKLQQRVLDLENTKTAQAQEITSLKLRVKNLEKKGGSRTHKLKRLYKVGRSARVISSDEASLGDQEDASKQGRIADIDVDAGMNLVSTHFDADTDMFGVHDLVGDEVVIETKIASKDMNLSVDKVTLAQALAALKTSTRPKAKGLVIHEEEQATTPTVSSQQPLQLKVLDKGKGKMVELKKPMKKKELIRLDKEIALKLQAEFDEEVRLAREKAKKEEEANIISWDNMQAMIDVDY
ncbi:hypothetical protein Tco_0016353 [Tanacetum coccineum]